MTDPAEPTPEQKAEWAACAAAIRVANDAAAARGDRAGKGRRSRDTTPRELTRLPDREPKVYRTPARLRGYDG